MGDPRRAARAARKAVSEVLLPRGWVAEPDGWWRRAPDGWAGLDVEVSRASGWLEDDAPPGSAYLSLHSGVGLDRLAHVAMVPWTAGERPPSHERLTPSR